MLQKLIQDWSRLSLFGRSKTIGGWDGLYWTVTDEALTNVVIPSVVIPYPTKYTIEKCYSDSQTHKVNDYQI